MKNFWKNLCIGAMSVVSVASLTACDKEKDVNYDLDGDGVVSSWETPFESKGNSNRSVLGAEASVIEISSLQELKSINDRATETNIYRLTKDIDCKGEEICINLAGSSFYGNNKTISNYKIGSVLTDAENKVIRCIMYNGVAVYDLNLYMGIQEIEVKDVQPSTKTIVSSIVDAPIIDNVHVKGNMKVDRITYGSSFSNVDVSMLCAVTDIMNSNSTSISITNSSVLGKLKFEEEMGGSTTTRIAGVIPAFAQGYSYDETTSIYSPTGSSVVYNVDANVEIDARTAHNLTVGLVVAEVGDTNIVVNDRSHAMVSSCSSSGKISTSIQASCYNMFVGGIAGKINTYGEVKDCNTTAEISYYDNGENTLVNTPNFYYGGIVGRNDGVVEYATSDAIISITNARQLKAGGIAGVSENGIFSNILCRGSINCSNINRVEVAEMVGKMTGGYIEKVIATTSINVDNTAENCNVVKLGMLVIFEEDGVEASKYNAYNSPIVSQVYMCGNSNVYMNPTTSSLNKFEYLLGLRNPYKYGTGIFETITGENGEESEVEVKDTRVPLKFRDLYTLKNGYQIRKYEKQQGENKEIVLDISYAPNVTAKDGSTIYQRAFFIGNMGFRFGLNHNEIDFANFDISKMKFTIDENSAKTGYFDKSTYNGEFAYFNKYIEDECSYTKADEMFSYIKYLFSNDYLLNTDSSIVTPLYISEEFIKSIPPVTIVPGEDTTIPEETPEGGEDMEETPEGAEGEGGSEGVTPITPDTPQVKTQYEMFAESIQELIEILYYADKNMTIVSEVQYLNKEYKDISSSDVDDVNIKYIKIVFSDTNNYVLTFDVSSFAEMDDISTQKNAYLVYLKFEKQ